MRRESEKLAIGDLAGKMSGLKVVGENLSEEERAASIQDLYGNVDEEVDFESFLKVNFLLFNCYISIYEYSMSSSQCIYFNFINFPCPR